MIHHVSVGVSDMDRRARFYDAVLGPLAVRAAWEGGSAAGGADDGAPGNRPQYGPAYYSAYLRDPDGNRVEIAVGVD